MGMRERIESYIGEAERVLQTRGYGLGGDSWMARQPNPGDGGADPAGTARRAASKRSSISPIKNLERRERAYQESACVRAAFTRRRMTHPTASIIYPRFEVRK